MNGRIYDPLLGRFLSADLVVSNPGDLQEFNRYSYVKNRPLTLTDPSGFAPADALSDRAFLRGAAAAFGAEKADTMLHQKIEAEGKGAATGALILATGGAGLVVGEAAIAGNTAAQLIVAGTAAAGLIDGTQKMAEGAGEFSVNPSVGSAAKVVAGGLEAGLSVAGVAGVRTALAEAPVVSSTAASTTTTAAADSASTPTPAKNSVVASEPVPGTPDGVIPTKVNLPTGTQQVDPRLLTAGGQRTLSPERLQVQTQLIETNTPRAGGPVVVQQNGVVVDGTHATAAAVTKEVPKITVVVVEGQGVSTTGLPPDKLPLR